MSEYRFLITHRYSARWASRYNKLELFNDAGEVADTQYFPVPDAMILCDLCNTDFPAASDTVIPILQHRRGTEPWTDIGTRCQNCQEGFEDVPRVEEDNSQEKSQFMTQCPQCKRIYEPELPPRPKGDRRMIQDIYPDAEPYQREQLQTGYCSDKCIDEAFSGTREPQYTYDEKGRRFENEVRKPLADPDPRW